MSDEVSVRPAPAPESEPHVSIRVWLAETGTFCEIGIAPEHVVLPEVRESILLSVAMSLDAMAGRALLAQAAAAAVAGVVH